MKKLIVIICVVVGCVATINAGESCGAYLKAGVNTSNLVMGTMSHGMKIGGHLGFGYEYKVTPQFGLAAELNMSFQGASIDPRKVNDKNNILVPEHIDASLDKNVTLNSIYFELPIIGKYYITPKIAIDLGPKFCLNSKNKIKLSDGSEYDTANTFEDWDLSVLAGITYNVSSKVLLQARYNLSLCKVMKKYDVVNEQWKYSGHSNDRIQNIQISVGYRF